MKKVLSWAIVILRLLFPILWSVIMIAVAIFLAMREMFIFIPVLMILTIWVSRIGKLGSHYTDTNLTSNTSDAINRAYSMIEKISQAPENEHVPLCLRLLVGLDFFRITHYKKQEHDYESVIDAIHVYCEKNPDNVMEKIYKNALYQLIDSMFLKKRGYSLIFDILGHELNKIINHTCAFEVDILEYTQYMKNKVDERISNNDEIEKGFNKWFAKRKQSLERTYREVTYEKRLRLYLKSILPPKSKKSLEVMSFDNETGYFYLEKAGKYIHSEDIIKIRRHGMPSSHYGHITIVTKTDNYKFSCNDYSKAALSILFLKYKYDLKNGKEDYKVYRRRYNWQSLEYNAENDTNNK